MRPLRTGAAGGDRNGPCRRGRVETVIGEAMEQTDDKAPTALCRGCGKPLLPVPT